MLQSKAIHYDTAIVQDRQPAPAEKAEVAGETLGNLLRRTRMSKGLELSDVSSSTKISDKNLQAMESNEFSALPAEVFTRGFYTLYAEILGLDPSLVLRQYDNEKPTDKGRENSLQGSISFDNEYNHMSERPSILPLSYMGMLVMLFLVLGGFLCWYFSINPASYLSQKIRTDEIENSHVLKSPEKEFFELHKMLSIPSTSIASEIQHHTISPTTTLNDKYIVRAHFKEATRVTLAIDDKPVFDSMYNKGDSVIWSAQERINITLPGKSSTLLSVNTTAIELPETDNATLTVSIPNDISK